MSKSSTTTKGVSTQSGHNPSWRNPERGIPETTQSLCECAGDSAPGLYDANGGDCETRTLREGGQALRLARFFGTSPEFWMNLQAMHDLTTAWQESGVSIHHDVRPHAC